MDTTKKDTIKQMVKEKYASLSDPSSCCCNMDSCTSVSDLGKKLNYSEKDLSCAIDAKMPVLGCGNPLAEAALKPGETVVDLGCGAGFDAFLSAKKVTKSGRVIGIDMTPEMIEKAKTNSKNIKAENVEFRLGEIENLPVPNSTADVVMSNCVINLSTDKSAVYREIYRILKPGGRISISDVLKSGEITKEIMNNPAAYTG
jgi:SAM-dependent methyltransferase